MRRAIWIAVPLTLMACSSPSSTQVAGSTTTTTPATTSISATTVPPTTSTTSTVSGPLSIVAASTTVAPTAPASSAPPSTKTALPSTTTTEPVPVIEERWEVSSPGAIDLQMEGAGYEVMVVADEGRTIEVRMPFLGGPNGGLVASISPTDANGAPHTITTLRSGVMMTIAMTSDGQLFTIAAEGWPEFGARVLPHPGVVTDVAFDYGVALGPGSGPHEQVIWTAGFDQVDGERRPTVWSDTGLRSDWNTGALTGVPTATVVASGEAGSSGRPMVAKGAVGGAFALLPEPDGMSRLWILHDAGDAPAVRTELRFRDPTAIQVGEGLALWIADSDGLHAIDVLASPMTVRTVTTTPVRSLIPGSPYDFPYAVSVLDTTGAVKAVSSSGVTREFYTDDAATDFLFVPQIQMGPRRLLYLVHPADDEVIVVAVRNGLHP